MSEAAIEHNVVVWLAFQGYGSIKTGKEGYPDRLVILGSNRHVWMEFKTPEGKLRPQQVNRISKLEELGETVFVVTSFEQGKECIASLRLSSPLSTYGNQANR